MYNPLLKVLVSVADCGSFARASEKLFLSTTAVMKQINSLEEHLGLRLFERTSRGVRLTAAGRSIYEDARQLFDFSEQAIERARHCAGTARRTLRVGTSLLNPCKVFMDLWQKASEELPGYALSIVTFEDNRDGILAEIASIGDRFDILVGACDSDAWKQRANFLILGEYRMCCAVSRTHRLAGKKELGLEDLEGECLMLGARGDSASVDRVRDELERHPGICLEDTSHFYDINVFNACEQQKKVLLTLECWQEVHPSLVTIPVRWDFSAPYGLLYPLSPGEDLQAVIAVLERVVAGEGLRH